MKMFYRNVFIIVLSVYVIFFFFVNCFYNQIAYVVAKKMTDIFIGYSVHDINGFLFTCKDARTGYCVAYLCHRIGNTESHLQCFSRKRFSSSICPSANTPNKNSHLSLEIFEVVMCERNRKDLNERTVLQQRSIDRKHTSISSCESLHPFLPHSTILNISKGRRATASV